MLDTTCSGSHFPKMAGERVDLRALGANSSEEVRAPWDILEGLGARTVTIYEIIYVFMLVSYSSE